MGLQISGSEVQDDVCRVFSFNVVGSPFNDSSLGKAVLVNGHDPPDISQTKRHEAESSSVSIASDDMDQHGISLVLVCLMLACLLVWLVSMMSMLLRQSYCIFRIFPEFFPSSLFYYDDCALECEGCW